MSLDTSERTKAGLQRHQAGQFAEAEAIYRSVLDVEPEHPEVLYLLSVLHLQTGRFEDAALFVEKAIGIRDDEPNYYNIAGEAYLALREAGTAIERYRQAIKLNPEFAGAHNNLGNAYRQSGDIEEAIAHYREALRIDSRMAMAHNNLGISLKELGRADEALEHFRKSVSIAPNYAEAHSNLGNLLQALGRLDEAVQHHEQALAIMPGYAVVHCNLGSALQALGRRDEAIRHYRQAVAIDPGFALAHFNLGMAASESGKPQDAVSHYRHALELDSDYAEAHNNLGNSLDELGYWDEAITHFEHARAIKPEYAEAYRNLARLEPARVEPADIERRLTEGDISEADTIQWYVTLGLVYDRRQDFTRSFENFRHANDLRRKSLNYDPRQWDSYVQRTIDAYTREYFDTIVPDGSDSERPVFIVGMHRSGTSLVEQIISCHPDVYGAGELPTIGEIEAALIEGSGQSSHYPQSMHQCDRDMLLRYAGRYLEKLETISGNGATRVSDKMPGNFAQIGLIRSLFPKARIVHCVRNAADTCVSNYFNAYATGNSYAYDLAELGMFYVGYRRLMRHWNTIFGAEIFDVHYEELVSDQESTSRSLIHHLGLEWDDNCLKFQDNARAVNALNSLAVRRPLYDSSIERWKRYEANIGPLLEILDA